MIARCNSEGESTAFIEFMLTQIDKILDDICTQIEDDREQTHDDADAVERHLRLRYDLPLLSGDKAAELERQHGNLDDAGRTDLLAEGHNAEIDAV